jgi:superfamily I DNA/RNA helicase/CRISPR/Cas system-associated exonuclease Cas4 (RecB family)
VTAPTETRITPDEWPQHLDDTDGPQLIVGGPGTGKTEFLVRRAGTLIDAGGGGHLLVVTFSRRGAVDLERRIGQAVARSMPAVDVTTYHSFARRLLETHATRRGWDSAPEVLPGPDQKRLIARLLSEEDPSTWAHTYRGLLDTSTFADEVTDFVLRCREQLIQPDDLAELDRDDWRGLAPFLQRYDDALRRRSAIDYGTLLSEAAALVADDAVMDELDRQYRYVLVDEYQDTTHAQATFLERLTRRHRNITAAADPYQSIYSFRGAELENVARFPEQFPDANGEPATRIVLTVSHRVPQPILEAAVRVTSHELPGAAGKVIATRREGSVETYRFEQQVEEAEWIASEIERLHLEQQIPHSRMAVFTRSKRRFLGPLSRALERRDIPHDRPDARLIDQPAVRFTLDVVIAATGAPAEVDLAVRRILLGPLFRTPLARLREIERERLRQALSWPAAIRALVPGGDTLAGFIEDPVWATRHPASVGLWELWSTLPQIHAIVADPLATEHRTAWSSLSQVLGRWNDREPTGTLDDYRRFAEADEFEASPLLAYQGSDRDRVTLTTLHQSKGLEFDVVFIADAVEGVFPDLRTRDSLLNTRHLQPSLPTDTTGYLRFRLDEERRLAYTAMTRATRRVVWTATDSGYSEGIGIPSRFLALAAGTDTVEEAAGRPPSHTRPITPREAESSLRRMLVDPSVPAAKRLGAAAVLATGPEHGLRHLDEFSGYLEPGPDDDIIGDTMHLSPSQADAYETCPRRYVLERRLGIGGGDSIYADFGTLIHDVLEAVESQATERDDQHATLDEALAELDLHLYTGRFGGGAFDAAWRERGRQGLTALYESWPSSGQPVAHEHDLHLTHGDTEWIGRADRIEARDGGLAVVDYKTPKTAMAVADAKRSLQLGFYVLASRDDETLSKVGIADQAELWYPLATLTKGITVRPFDIDRLPEVEDRMRAVADGIRDEHWEPRPNKGCAKCPVRSVCPARPEGREAFTG